MIERILPESTVCVEAYDDTVETSLFPEEEALVAGAVDKRRREFATVRHCARAALAKLDVEPMPILPGKRGAPRWPAGVVGSMTHCAGYRAAVVARSQTYAGIGIDAEPHDRLPDGVLEVVGAVGERLRLGDLTAAAPAIHWDRVLFSAKESVYKAWYPLTGRWLDFSEADITLDPAGTFVARLLVPGPEVAGRPVDAFSGRFLVERDLVLSVVVLPNHLTPERGPAG